jgi:DNA polymerase I-like protein with 3'-5' exonuclease and polymerase domains
MSRIKQCFGSRWGNKGSVVQVDFSQLEVVGAAFLSQDPNMYEDILAGIDSHSQSASWLTEHTYEEVLDGYNAKDKYFTQVRKDAKGPRFELQYGAGAASIAENNGITKANAQGFIDNYYGRYHVLQAWQESNIRDVKATTEGREKTWEVDGVTKTHKYIVGKLSSITGREYTFKQFDTPDWVQEQSGRKYDFSPTQIKNFPSQGFATGDVVPMMLGHSYRRLLKSDTFRDKALHIGTIHDSILYDVHDDVLESFKPGIKKLMELAPRYIQETWGFEFDLPLKAEVEAGRTWDSME